MIGRDELMRYLDGELPGERAREVERELASSTELRRELAQYRAMGDDLRTLGDEMTTDDSVWGAVSRGLSRPVGWAFFLIGVTAWTAYGVYTYLTGADAMWEKLATSAVVLGLGILLLSALVDRYRDLKTDPYKEIQR